MLPAVNVTTVVSSRGGDKRRKGTVTITASSQGLFARGGAGPRSEGPFHLHLGDAHPGGGAGGQSLHGAGAYEPEDPGIAVVPGHVALRGPIGRNGPPGPREASAGTNRRGALAPGGGGREALRVRTGARCRGRPTGRVAVPASYPPMCSLDERPSRTPETDALAGRTVSRASLHPTRFLSHPKATKVPRALPRLENRNTRSTRETRFLHQPCQWARSSRRDSTSRTRGRPAQA